ncbi:MAG: hypothetical protein KGZ30_04075 [Anaplasmataceae bacterium]|nr:hypothetical protein [Anaplasmataceae bacterium]
MPKKHILLIRAVDRAVYDLIKSDKKKIETRAAGPKYKNIKKGDILVLKCGKDRLEKKVKRVSKFKSVSGMLQKYKPSQIDPRTKMANELKAMYDSFPGYKERLRKYGVIAFEV